METQTLSKTLWKIDPSHSEVHFKVKHLVISTVTGSFKSFEGAIETMEDTFDESRVSCSIDVSSIDTNAPDRDAHLKSEDFFAVEKYPKMNFDGTLVKRNDKYELQGMMTIRDITKPITLNVEPGGVMTDGYGQTKAGFEISGKINRKEFGLNWDMVTEAGGIVVGDEVRLVLNIQLTRM